MAQKDNAALIIGRFQPFHRGHLEILSKISREYSKVIIGIGSSQYDHTEDNPFSATERREMISSSLDDIGVKNYTIVEIPDLNNHSRWVGHVRSLCPSYQVVYSNEPLTVKLFGEAGDDVRGIPFFNRNEYSGTEVRRRMRGNGDWKSLVPIPVIKIIEKLDISNRMNSTKGVK